MRRQLVKVRHYSVRALDDSREVATSRLAGYVSSNQLRKAFEYAKSIDQPSSPQLTSLLQALRLVNNASVTGVPTVNLLQYASDHGIKVNSTGIQHAEHLIRSSSDPFVCEAGSRLLQALGYSRSDILCIKITSCIQSLDIDSACYYTSELGKCNPSALQLAKLPTKKLIQILLDNNALAEVLSLMELLRSRELPIDNETWLLVLESALREYDYDNAKLIYRKIDSAHCDIPQTMYSVILQLAAEKGDIAFLKDLAFRVEPYTTVEVGALIDAFANHPPTITTDLIKTAYTVFQINSGVHPKDTPAFNHLLASWVLNHLKSNTTKVVVETLKGLDGLYKTFLLSCMLYGLRMSHTPAVASFKLYRDLSTSADIAPDTTTLDQLLFTAYYFGNSKKLSYLIYQEVVSHDVVPSRAAFETLLRIALSGSRYDSVFFFMKEMRRFKVPLRTHIHRTIMSRFRKIGDIRYEKLFPNVDSNLSNAEFPTDEELRRSSRTKKSVNVTYSYKRDMLNCEDFVNGWKGQYLQL
ncbi:hypothetical protein TRVA0_007S00892 [Trichomonascus vanleenenianus]|uniref:uncharacterized protein n=1 Tax=Trichomonascus vanleenenianus TaxID=2268995 RepID=UPI003ECA1A59